MQIHTYKNGLWLYRQDRVWPRIKKEIPIILIILALGLILVAIANTAERDEHNFRTNLIANV